MAKRKQPETSLEAYRNLDPVRLSQLQQDIVRAVGALKEANFEAIADFLMVKPEKVWKRLKECVDAGFIYKPGNTVLTKNGAKSYVYRLTNPTEPSTSSIERFPKGTGAYQHAAKIIQQSKLFDL